MGARFQFHWEKNQALEREKHVVWKVTDYSIIHYPLSRISEIATNAHESYISLLQKRDGPMGWCV
jgi:hypothetical protein